MSKPISAEKAFQKEVKNILSYTTADAVICRKDGTVEAKTSYFYRHGMTGEKYAEQVRDILHRSGIPARVVGEDRYANWPKTSYFVAIITPVYEPKEGN